MRETYKVDSAKRSCSMGKQTIRRWSARSEELIRTSHERVDGLAAQSNLSVRAAVSKDVPVTHLAEGKLAIVAVYRKISHVLNS